MERKLKIDRLIANRLKYAGITDDQDTKRVSNLRINTKTEMLPNVTQYNMFDVKEIEVQQMDLFSANPLKKTKKVNPMALTVNSAANQMMNDESEDINTDQE